MNFWGLSTNLVTSIGHDLYAKSRAYIKVGKRNWLLAVRWLPVSVKGLGHQDYHVSVKDPLDWAIWPNTFCHSLSSSSSCGWCIYRLTVEILGRSWTVFSFMAKSRVTLRRWDRNVHFCLETNYLLSVFTLHRRSFFFPASTFVSSLRVKKERSHLVTRCKFGNFGLGFVSSRSARFK